METTKFSFDENGYGELALYSDNVKAGLMEISLQDKLLTVYHTEVDDQFAGKGFGKILLKTIVDYARENNLQIMPLCPYVHAQFKRHEADYQDVWHKTNEQG